MIIPAVKLYNPAPKKQTFGFLRSSKSAESDTFVRTTERKIMQHNNKFEATGNIDIEKLKKTYGEKIKTMPLIMSSAMHDIENYIGQKFDAEQFVKSFTEDSSALAKRISIGADKEEYCKNYAPEITLINGISAICDDLHQGNIEKNVFDFLVINKVVSYVEDETVRKKHFLG